MAIFHYGFKHPLNVSDVPEVDIKTGMIFSSKNEEPPGFAKNITPAGNKDEYKLKTRTESTKKREDTIGEIEVTRSGGGKVTAYSMGLEGGEGSQVETENQLSKYSVVCDRPVFILARPNALDGGKGIRVNGKVRYRESTETFT